MSGASWLASSRVWEHARPKRNRPLDFGTGVAHLCAGASYRSSAGAVALSMRSSCIQARLCSSQGRCRFATKCSGSGASGRRTVSTHSLASFPEPVS